MLESQRAHFSIPPAITYLDAAYMSPIPTSALDAGVTGTAVKAAPWLMTIDSYYDDVEAARGPAAGMINAEAGDVAIVSSTSYGMAVAAANLPLRAGSTILLMENEHPSHRYVWYDAAQRAGAQIRIIDRPADGDWTTAMIAAIESTADLAVVAGTMVHWFEGMRVDIAAVADATRLAGGSLAIDGTQWVGAVPFDVKRVRPDFMVFATYKFLLGPYRLAFLYADPRWQQEGRPIEHHVWNRAGGEKSDFYAATVLPFQPGARRFDMGERSDFAVLPVAIKSLQLIQHWTVEKVSARILHLNRLIWEEADKAGLVIADERFRTLHIAILDLGRDIPAAFGQNLKANNIHVTVRGSKLRMSPHVYNDEADIRRVFDFIQAG